jgi:sensor c-di-GMP phosphodiesterase-like protein
MAMVYTLTEKAIEIWKRAYSKRRGWTVTLTIMLLLAIAFIVGLVIYKERLRVAEVEKRRLQDLSFNQQLDALNNVQGSLNNLIAFVELQKTKLRESEELLNNLRLQKDQLQPAVAADQKTVEALLALQSQRTEQNLSRERWYGILIGVLSSLLASLVISLGKNFMNRRRRTPPNPPTQAGT